jgi:hypothetical protein
MIKGIFFLTFMIFGAFATVVLMIPSLSLLLLHSKRIISWRRRYNSFLCGIYLDFAGTLMSIFGTKVFVYSETPEIFQDKGILITSNHRTRIDWMFVGTRGQSIVHIINLTQSLSYRMVLWSAKWPEWRNESDSERFLAVCSYLW